MSVEVHKISCPNCGGPNSGEAGAMIECRFCASGYQLPQVEGMKSVHHISKKRVDLIARGSFRIDKKPSGHSLLFDAQQFVDHASGGDGRKGKVSRRDTPRLAALFAVQKYMDFVGRFNDGNDSELWNLMLEFGYEGEMANPDFVHGYTVGLAALKTMLYLQSDDGYAWCLTALEEIFAGTNYH